jgi:hypothetical protein
VSDASICFEFGNMYSLYVLLILSHHWKLNVHCEVFISVTNKLSKLDLPPCTAIIQIYRYYLIYPSVFIGAFFSLITNLNK